MKIQAFSEFVSRGRRSLSTVAVAVLVGGTSALAVTGCGSSSSSGVSDPVAQAATTSAKVAGLRMNLSMQFSVPGTASAFTATGTGSFDQRKRSGSMTLDMNLGNNPQVVQALGGSTLHLEEVISGLTIYMKLPPALTSKMPLGGKPWFKIDLAKAANAAGIPGLSSLADNPASSDPSQFLQYLRAVSGGVTNEGSETVNGIQTTHYRAKIDLNRVPNVLSGDARKAAEQTINTLKSSLHSSTLPVDVWIDAQHLVRQMRMSFQAAVSGSQAVGMTMTMAIPEYGPQPAPVLPPADQVTDISTLLGSSSSSG